MIKQKLKGFYRYYKLQATDPIFPTKTNGKLSKYKHLGKAGSQAYLEALEQITARAKIDALPGFLTNNKKSIHMT